MFRYFVSSIITLLLATSLVKAKDIDELNIIGLDGVNHAYSMADLKKETQHTIQTNTPWTVGIHEFKGVLLNELLEKAGIDLNDTDNEYIIKASALNNYVIDIPFEKIKKYPAIIAILMDGEQMPISNKGPYWIVFPRNDYSELQDLRFDHYWAWQLNQIKIIKK